MPNKRAKFLKDPNSKEIQSIRIAVKKDKINLSKKCILKSGLKRDTISPINAEINAKRAFRLKIRADSFKIRKFRLYENNQLYIDVRDMILANSDFN